jgi:hypothetical protein
MDTIAEAQARKIHTLTQALLAILDNRAAMDAYRAGFERGMRNRPVETARREDENYVMGHRAGCELRGGAR